MPMDFNTETLTAASAEKFTRMSYKRLGSMNRAVLCLNQCFRIQEQESLSMIKVVCSHLVMYKIKKQTKRTSKQLFAILKDKLLELARSQPKIKVAQLSHQKIIFPEQLKFPAPNPEEMADQSVTLADLKDHPTAKYEFYLQSYQININDELLSLLRPQCIYSIPEQHANGRPSCIAANSKGVVAVGFDSGKVAIVSDLANKAFEVLQASTQTILCLDINETCLLCCDAVGHCSYF